MASAAESPGLGGLPHTLTAVSLLLASLAGHRPSIADDQPDRNLDQPFTTPLFEPERKAEAYDVSATVRATTFDILLELSPIGWAFEREDNCYTGLLRLGAGIHSRVDRLAFSHNITYQLSRTSYSTFGLQFNLYSRSVPFGAHLAGLIDVSGNPGYAVSVAVYYAISIEFQQQFFDRRYPMSAVYLRLPSMSESCWTNSPISGGRNDQP